MIEVNSNTICGHHQQLWLFVEELSQSQIADSLLYQSGASDEFETLHLTEICLLTRHVDEEQLRHVSWSHSLLVFLGYKTATAKDSRMTAISFWYYARSSAIVFVFLILVTNSCSLLIIYLKCCLKITCLLNLWVYKWLIYTKGEENIKK